MRTRTGPLAAAAAAVIAVGVLAGCGTPAAAPSPSPTPVISMPTTDPSTQAQIDAATTAYRGYKAAREKLYTDGPTPANIAAAKAYSANDVANQAIDAEAQQIKDKGSKLDRATTAVSVQLEQSSLTATPPTVTLVACYDNRSASATNNGTPVAAATSFYTEHPTMELQNGKWLVYSNTGRGVDQCA